MRKFRIIAQDVYKKNIKSLSFIIMIAVPFIFIGIIYIAGIVASNNSDTIKIGLVSDDEGISKQMIETKNEDYSFELFESKKQGEKALKEEKIKALLLLSTANDQVKGQLYVTSSLGITTEMLIQQSLNNAQASIAVNKLQLNAQEIASLSAPAIFQKNKVRFDNQGEIVTSQDDTTIRTTVSFVATILLWMIIMTYASIIAQEIASEKGSRIMEIILSSTKAQTHFYGKVVGVLCVALTQLVIYAIIFALGFSQLRNIDLVKNFLKGMSFQNLFGSFLVYTILFALMGIFVYSILAALCGSLVSKPEDTAKSVQPIIYFGMISYFIGILLGTSDPQNMGVRVTSYIPFMSSFIMPVRLATDTASGAEAFISMSILLLFSLVLANFSANLYKSNVLVYNDGGIWQSLRQSIVIWRNERKK